MNEEEITRYDEKILFEELSKDKLRRSNILINLNVSLQNIQRITANIKDFRELQEYKIAVVSVENELKELQKENQQLKQQLEQRDNIINKAREFIKNHNEKAGKLYYKYDNKYLLSEIKEDLLEILNIDKGDE